MGCQGGQTDAVGVGLDKGASSRHAVGGASSGGGKDDSVADALSEQVSVDKDFELDRPRRRTTVETDLVEDVEVIHFHGVAILELVASEYLPSCFITFAHV